MLVCVEDQALLLVLLGMAMCSICPRSTEKSPGQSCFVPNAERPANHGAPTCTSPTFKNDISPATWKLYMRIFHIYVFIN